MKIVLGTMNFGPQLDEAASREMVTAFLTTGNRELDTAYVYNGGSTETILGAILPSLPESSFEIATKVHPRITGRLDRETIMMELGESLQRMKRDRVDLLYFHFPDGKTPVEEALETVAELHQKGVIRELGLSNYPAWQVVDIAYKCDTIGCPRPTVYQGMYNALCRNVEPELFPAIRSLGMRFYAFNPLAGGMLTGKHLHFEDTPEPGRFARLESYRKRYWKQSYFDAVDEIRKACEAENIPMAEAGYRWLCYHSMMDAAKDDGILLGASRQEQMTQNMAATTKGPLPQSVLDAMDAAWEMARPDSPAYYKFI
ncbi:MAG: aldo/keto reductase [Prevotella sp.]|nr:aldo/keto reductase [Prevotella sp.]MBO7539821.1 aldo/keto reductase [Prevotella sp.]